MKKTPPVPPEVDLSSLEYMPLYIARLRGSKSWLITKRKPELLRPMLAMWMRAWQERPAGSLEADDDVLADAAELTFDDWQRNKADLLRGWELSTDNRYYLQSMVPMVQAGWTTVLGKKKRAKAGAAARWGSMLSEDADKHASKHASTDAMEGRKEGRKKGNGSFHAQQTPTQAWQEVRSAIRSGKKPEHWSDPRTAKALDAIGGWGAVVYADSKSLDFRIKDFAEAYQAYGH